MHARSAIPVLIRNCLDYVVSGARACSAGKKGGRVISPSCTVWYELYPFLADPPVVAEAPSGKGIDAVNGSRGE
ncbi:hypothetical protein RHGRI_037312 [Rhododendron griersonianum]|uniref:Gnk2-homologous domain-containing protein n=1 Tax=Rhododendron griersonianum TaxID=479676 RepID=A0AAV6HRB4_9ERIC|nr:hypothetical protein RHGRI_037312 [Rhododendron griersonianum]